MTDQNGIPSITRAAPPAQAAPVVPGSGPGTPAPKGDPATYDPESGSASVLAVSGIGVLALMAMLGLSVRVVAERRSVEDSIAEMRAYWAAMGHAAYLLSRTTAASGNSNNSSGGGSAKDGAENILKEFGPNNKLPLTWLYPDISSGYAFTATPKVVAVSGAVGEVDLCIDFKSGPAAPEALRSVAQLRTLNLRYCIVPLDGSVACGLYSPRKQDVQSTRIIFVSRSGTSCP